MINKDILFLILPIHILSIILIYNFNIWLFLIGWFIIGCIGQEIGLHRYFGHKAFKLSMWQENILATISIFPAQGGPLWWASAHAHHHKHSDTKLDIHSPIQGKWFAFLGWYFVPSPVKIIRRDLLKNKYLKYIHLHHKKIYWITVLPLLFIPEIVLNLFLLPAVISFWGVNLVNWLCHDNIFGYKNFDTKDNSKNLPILSLFTWGLSLHENHHWDQTNPSHSVKWWEIDIAGEIIKKWIILKHQNI